MAADLKKLPNVELSRRFDPRSGSTEVAARIELICRFTISRYGLECPVAGVDAALASAEAYVLEGIVEQAKRIVMEAE